MDEKFSLYNIADILAEKTGKATAETEKFIEELIALINDGITKDKLVKIKGIGTFKVVLVKERESVHVNTGERILIPAHHKLSFLPDKLLKEQINKPFAFFETIEASEENNNEISNISLSNDEDEDEDEEVVEEETSTNEDSPVMNTIPPLVTPTIDKKLPEPEETKEEAPSIEESLSEDRGIERETTKEEPFEEEPPFEEAPHEEANIEEKETNILTPSSTPFEKEEKEDDDFMNREIKKEVEWSEDRPISNEPAAQAEEKQQSTPLWAATNKTTEMKTENERMTQNEPSAEPRARQSYKKKSKKSSNMPLYIVLGILLVLLCSCLVYYFYYNSSYDDLFNKNQTAKVTGDSFAMPGDSTAIKEAQNMAKVDTAVIAPSEPAATTTTSKDKATNTKPEQPKTQSASSSSTAKPAASSSSSPKSSASTSSSSSTSSSNKVIARVSMEPGERLTLLAEKYYGNKIFWVYIYDYNKTKIPDPDRIPTGMEIQIPAKEVYGIDAKSTASREKARELQSRIMSKK